MIESNLSPEKRDAIFSNMRGLLERGHDEWDIEENLLIHKSTKLMLRSTGGRTDRQYYVCVKGITPVPILHGGTRWADIAQFDLLVERIFAAKKDVEKILALSSLA